MDRDFKPGPHLAVLQTCSVLKCEPGSALRKGV